MRLTVWDHPVSSFLVSGVDFSPYRGQTEVMFVDRRSAISEILAGRTDVALISAYEALKYAEEIDVLPAVALSSWKNPFIRLILDGGLENAPDEVAIEPGVDQENILARIVLKEHYEMTPKFVESSDRVAGRVEVLATPSAGSEGFSLDLGQEWVDLSGYPMIWAVFAGRKGEIDDAMIHQVRSIVLTSEDRKALWLKDQQLSAEEEDFYTEQLRVNFDDLVVAGLTELRQLLFFYNVFDEVRELPVVYLSEDNEESQA